MATLTIAQVWSDFLKERVPPEAIAYWESVPAWAVVFIFALVFAYCVWGWPSDREGDNAPSTIRISPANTHAHQDGTFATPNLSPEAVAYYNEQARRLEERKQRRPLWKTIIFGGLLYALNPIGGTALAHIYVHTRNDPKQFKFGEAFVTGWLAFFCFLITLSLVVGVILLAGGVTGFIQEGHFDEIGNTLNDLLRRR